MNLYNSIAQKYDAWYENPESMKENRLITMMLESFIHNRMVVDIGCGTGLLLDLHKVEVESYVGVDPSASMLSRLEKKHPCHRVINSEYRSEMAIEGAVHCALFGSASYLTELEICSLLERDHFLMFYRPGYVPKIYEGVTWPPEVQRFEVERLDGTRFSDWVIVTNL